MMLFLELPVCVADSGALSLHEGAGGQHKKTEQPLRSLLISSIPAEGIPSAGWTNLAPYHCYEFSLRIKY